MAKKRNYEWVTLQYEQVSFDVCISTSIEEIEEILPSDSETNIYPLMRDDVIDWMLDQALAQIQITTQSPAFLDMNRHERKIEEEGCYQSEETLK